jgi:hypothetical protein
MPKAYLIEIRFGHGFCPKKDRITGFDYATVHNLPASGPIVDM